MNSLINILDQNKIPCNEIATGISCNYNMKQYIIQKENDGLKLLESNLALNPKKKNKFHRIDKLFPDIDLLIGFIKNRNIYSFN